MFIFLAYNESHISQPQIINESCLLLYLNSSSSLCLKLYHVHECVLMSNSRSFKANNDSFHDLIKANTWHIRLGAKTTASNGVFVWTWQKEKCEWSIKKIPWLYPVGNFGKQSTQWVTRYVPSSAATVKADETRVVLHFEMLYCSYWKRLSSEQYYYENCVLLSQDIYDTQSENSFSAVCIYTQPSHWETLELPMNTAEMTVNTGYSVSSAELASLFHILNIFISHMQLPCHGQQGTQSILPCRIRDKITEPSPGSL